MTRALVFDLDGTLVDSLPAIAASLNRALADLGHPPHPEPVVRGFVGNGLAVLARRALGGAATDALVAQVTAAFRAEYGRRWAEGTFAYPGIPAALAVLAARVPLAVWSNKPHPFTVAMVAGMFPDVPFAAVLGEREAVPRKPDPAAAAELCAALGTPARAIIMVGDSATDIVTARNAGFGAAAVTWGYHDRSQLAAAGPDCWVEAPGELPGLLE